ncbi:MAG: hypothetical protein ACTHMV_12110 [Chitinophagaceae bacterium]
MKKKLWLLIVITLATNVVLCAQSSPSEQLAGRIADRMKDSLLLSSAQRSGIYTINMQLHEQKMNVRKQYSQSEWTAFTQRIENTRDSLYHTVLADEELYQRYKAKKAALIRAD